MENGLLYSWSSPFIVKITNDNETYNISETEASYFATIPTIATMFFSIVFAMLCDIIGRKATLLLIVIPAVIAWLLKAFAKDVVVFYIARVFVGIDTGCFFAALPIYVGETVSPEVRGMLGSWVTTFNFIGQFLINVIGNYFSVPTTSYMCLPLSIIFFVCFCFMPESPYFYIMKGRHEEAKKSLWRLRRKRNIEEDFMKLKRDVERQMSERGTWKDLVMIKSNRKAILIGLFLRTAQLMSGAAVFVSSIQFIFDKAPGDIPSATAAMVYSFLTCSFFLCAGGIIDKMGRRVAFTSSLTLTSVVLLMESLYYFLREYHPEIDLSSLDWFALAARVVFVLFASFGPGLIPTLMISEIFSTSIKAKANIIMVFALALFSTVSNLIFYALFNVTGLCGPFFLFSIISTICAVLSYCYLPETKGKTLEEIQQMLKGN